LPRSAFPGISPSTLIDGFGVELFLLTLDNLGLGLEEDLGE
jgi:hypothetical protein